MNLFIILSSVAFTSFLILGVYILSFKPRTNISVLFFIKSLLLSSCIVTGLMVQLSQIQTDMELWHKINLCLITVFTAVFLHFYISLTKTPAKPAYKLFIYIPSIIVLFLILSGPATIHHAHESENGLWQYSDNFSIVSLKAYVVHVTVYPVLVLYLIYRWGRKSAFNKVKLQSRILFIGIVVTLVISDVCDLILNRFSFYKLPHILFIILIVYFFALSYTLVKYSFMKFRMSDIAGQILSNIQDIVIILNPDRTFMDANVSFTKKISRGLSSLRKHRIDDYIIMDGILEKKFEELQMSKKNSLTGRIIYRTDSDHLITDSYISRITDAFNDFSGFLIVSKENRGIADLRTQYSITEKQFRIIELLINGLSNREISEKFGIHKRTVETHVLSIYNKLGVNNRIELLNLINEYYIQK